MSPVRNLLDGLREELETLDLSYNCNRSINNIKQHTNIELIVLSNLEYMTDTEEVDAVINIYFPVDLRYHLIQGIQPRKNRLELLKLICCHLMNPILKGLVRVSKLKKVLLLRYRSLTYPDFLMLVQILPKMISLEYLCLENIQMIDDNVLIGLSKSSMVRNISLLGLDNIKDAVLLYLAAKANKLEQLKVSRCSRAILNEAIINSTKKIPQITFDERHPAITSKHILDHVLP
ncbi:hypothetical protein BDA99DRAFT_586920 [Phascolomyces articulosus]|uniref:Uncharacterized protein n=1 Tax=Phascolomyces articulosus TaxID=60185 RepID=A0AAD5PAH2_9FUNG|nr:hypothetical protein BDA99DRAFT_586920 [Phascolomyces articulosus]